MMKQPSDEQERTALEEAPTATNGGTRRRQDIGEQLGEILKVMVAYRNGDFSVRLPSTWTGVLGKMSDTMNDILAVSQRRAEEVVRISRVVGKEGRLRQRLSVPGVSGGWADEIDSLNTLIDDLASPTTEVTRAVGAVGKGDLSQAMALDKDGRPLEGEFLRSAKLVNKMIEQLAVFTSEVTRVAREVGPEGKLDAASGTAGIVIGTHALLSDNVSFYDLGLIVVDEQHRFGVEQRDALRAKARKPPHLLVMTATPIPRTVAMTVFGDLETSTLDELPKGRAPISTHLVGLAENPGWVARIWARAREEIDAGHQVYVVCPKIGTDDDGDFSPGEAAPSGMDTEETRELASVTAVVDHLQGEPSLAGVPLAPLHGRQDPDLKTETMAGFTANRIKLLVSTTVIEVGVDVHNATLMVILDADRFGISQLHQLRGRVGRGGLPGTCLLVTTLEPGHPSRRRLDAVAATTDGFELSQEDLKLRREGDILGASQSGGRSTLKLLRVLEHEDVIARARQDAQAIVAADPALGGQPLLAAAIDDYLNPEKEAFLERG